MREFVIRTTLVLSFIVFVLVGFLYKQLFSPLTDQDKVLFIPFGTEYLALKDSLRSHDLLKNEFCFDLLVDKKTYVNIHPGRYRIDVGMDANSLVNMLRLGSQEPMNLIFNNVSTIQDLVGKIAIQIEADSASLEACFTNKDFLALHKLSETSIRKIFIPNTYQVYWSISPEEFLERMIQEYERFWTSERLEKSRSIGLSPEEVSVLASIVQKESSKADEQAMIAGLYMNRLSKGMKLQSDPTVIYALKEQQGFDTLIKRVLKKDLKIDSPFNTYLYKGLPPSPICIPEMSALQSVLNFKHHKYIYMCAKEDFSGYHNFAASWAQHKVNARRYQKALSEQGVLR